MHHIPEQPIDPLEDTSPSIRMRPVEFDRRLNQLPMWRRMMGWISLLGTAGFTVATILLLILPNDDSTTDASTVAAEASDIPATVTESPTELSPTDAPVTSVAQVEPVILPTLSHEQITNILLTPIDVMASDSGFGGADYNPFTIVPNRSRSAMIQYTVVQGDTIDKVAERYGLERESIAWCNDARKAQVIYQGDVLNIPPSDGVCHVILGSRALSIADLAAQYKIEDVYQIIDSPFLDLPGLTPETVLPSGVRLFLQGGQGFAITWDPPVVEDASGNIIAFAPGQAGSCGSVSGGGTFWGNPLPNGRWIRGFYAGHTGLDLAASTGTPIFAANGGPILYAGWNSWGYGNTVVIGHGPISTLYGHMTSVAVGCGQVVGTGQVIGYVGSTGNSSGPHLHFEIRSRNQPQDPSGTPGIGW